jgi:hypothetical protein
MNSALRLEARTCPSRIADLGFTVHPPEFRPQPVAEFGRDPEAKP